MTELAFANGFRLPEESGNRGGWFSAKVQELARQHAPSAIEPPGPAQRPGRNRQAGRRLQVAGRYLG